jgi:hypothetical protein
VVEGPWMPVSKAREPGDPGPLAWTRREWRATHSRFRTDR